MPYKTNKQKLIKMHGEYLVNRVEKDRERMGFSGAMGYYEDKGWDIHIKILTHLEDD